MTSKVNEKHKCSSSVILLFLLGKMLQILKQEFSLHKMLLLPQRERSNGTDTGDLYIVYLPLPPIFYCLDVPRFLAKKKTLDTAS